MKARRADKCGISQENQRRQPKVNFRAYKKTRIQRHKKAENPSSFTASLFYLQFKTFVMEVLEAPSLQLDTEQHKTLVEVSDDELNLPPSDDEEETTTEAKSKEVVEKDEAEEGDKGNGQVNGVMILTLLDKIIGRVDQIQQTQAGLEARQQEMERSVTGIEGELTKLTKSHTTTANSVNKMLEKVRKVSVNVKTVRSNLEKQGGQIKRLENNENELLKRRNFKVMIYQVRKCFVK